MDMDEVQTQACRKVSRSGNGISGHQTEELNGTVSGNAEVGDSGINRLRGWNPSSRIIRVSRASGGKDRHSKVWTSKGLRDRRVRLSVSTAIQFYDLQDRLGYDQPSKAVEWLIKSAADSIAELLSINTSFPDNHYQLSDEKLGCNGGHNHQNEGFSLSKSTCSSTSDTSKNSSGLSLSRSEIRGNNRVKARERARERATKEKERDNNNNRNVEPQNSSSFTQLLTGSFGDGSDNSPAGYFSHQGYNGQFQPGTSFPHHQGMSSVPPFSISGDQNHHHQEPLHKFSFVPESLIQSAGSAGGDYGTLNFSISSSSSSGGGLSGYNRGTLQSNSPSLFTTNLQRFSSSSSTNVDGSNLPFFIGSTASPFENHHNNHNNHHQHHEFLAGSDGSLQLYYNGDGNRCSSDHKDKGKK